MYPGGIIHYSSKYPDNNLVQRNRIALGSGMRAATEIGEQLVGRSLRSRN